MAKETRTTAIVVRTQPFGESDLIVSLLSREHGLVRGFAKGALRSRKRFAGCFEPFTELELSLVLKDDTLARLVSADVTGRHSGISVRLDRIQAGSAMLELANSLDVPAQELDAAYTLAVSAIGQMDESLHPFELAAVFMVRYLDVAGFGIAYGHCGSCGEKFAGAAIYAGGEGVLCTRCGQGGRELSAGLMAFIRRASVIDEAKLTRLRLGAAEVVQFYGFIREYIAVVTGRRLNSLAGLVF